MKISIAEVKRRLPVGQEFIGEFIGDNAHRAAPDIVRTRRKVEKQTSQMKSVFLDGGKKGRPVYLGWSGIKAEEVDGDILLSFPYDGRDNKFLKITVLSPAE